MNLSSGYQKLDGMLATVGGWLQPVLLFLMRLWWGWSFFVAGKGHLSDIDSTAAQFAKWGVPLPKLNVILAGSTECVGGLLLLVGLCSRLISVPLMFTMLVAYLTADREAFFAFFSDTDKFVSATPFQFLLTCLIVFAFGPGVISLDALIFKKAGNK